MAYTRVAQLTQAGLIDEYLMVVTPVVLVGARRCSQFKNGNVVLSYERVI